MNASRESENGVFNPANKSSRAEGLYDAPKSLLTRVTRVAILHMASEWPNSESA